MWWSNIYRHQYLRRRKQTTFGATRKTTTQGEHHLEIQSRNYALKELKEENKILFRDLASIQDSNIRAYVQTEQTQMLQKMDTQHQDQGTPHASTTFNQYFSDLGGSRNNLPDY